MARLKMISVLVLTAVVLILITLFLVGYFSPKSAGLNVNSNVVASVYINGLLVGKTPFDITRNPEEVIVRVVPENSEISSNIFETKVVLSSGIKTIIKHDFGPTDRESQGEIVSFEKTGAEASLAIITIPDGAQITLDGRLLGFSPKKIDSINAGQHQIIVSADGYEARTFTVRTYEKYKLTAVVQLAKTPNGEVQASPTPLVTPKSLTVKILETPNGFLRVRRDPSVDSPEVARVSTGETYALIDADSTPGWYKIESGWISSTFAQKIEE